MLKPLGSLWLLRWEPRVSSHRAASNLSLLRIPRIQYVRPRCASGTQTDLHGRAGIRLGSTHPPDQMGRRIPLARTLRRESRLPAQHLTSSIPLRLLQPSPLHTTSVWRTACRPSATRGYRKLRHQMGHQDPGRFKVTRATAGAPSPDRVTDAPPRPPGPQGPWAGVGAERGVARLEGDAENRPATGPLYSAMKAAWRLAGVTRDVTEKPVTHGPL